MNARCHCSNDRMAARGDRTRYQTKYPEETMLKSIAFFIGIEGPSVWIKLFNCTLKIWKRKEDA